MKRSRSLRFRVVSSSISAITAGFLGLILPLAFFSGTLTFFHPIHALCSFTCPLIIIIDPSPQLAALGYLSVAGIAAGLLDLTLLFWPSRNLALGFDILLGSMCLLLLAAIVSVIAVGVIPTFYLLFPLASVVLMLGATLLLFPALSTTEKLISKN